MQFIDIFNNSEPVGKTSKINDVVVTKELMRMYTLSFNLLDMSKFQYINETASFVADGQGYDIANYEKCYGADNFANIGTALHIGYRLNNYIVPAGYAFVGTIAEIIADILDVAVDTNGIKASTEFIIGTCTDLGTKSISLNNDQPVTARFAILAMKTLGVEVDFDNFTLNFPVECGTGKLHKFEFGKDLNLLRIRYSKGSGTTYEVDIANLQRIEGYDGDSFDVGDHVVLRTDNEIISTRIITYTKHLDNPVLDSITMGVFIKDASTEAVMTSVEVDKCIKVTESYNNVSINHTDGFKATTEDGKIKVLHNATNGFLILHIDSKIFEVDSETGEIRITSSDGNYQVRLGAEKAFGIYKRVYGIYELIGGQDIDGHTMAERICKADTPQNYAEIGTLESGGIGLELFENNNKFCGIAALVGGGAQITSGDNSTGIWLNGEYPTFSKDGNGFGATDNIETSGYRYKFINGIYYDKEAIL